MHNRGSAKQQLVSTPLTILGYSQCTRSEPEKTEKSDPTTDAKWLTRRTLHGARFERLYGCVRLGQGTQNPVGATSCEFDSHLGHVVIEEKVRVKVQWPLRGPFSC